MTTIDEMARYMADEDAGLCGEFLAYMELQVPAPCRCLWNLEIPKAKGQYSQVDLLLIHTTGLYVLESKNYSPCRVYGDEERANWKVFYSKNRGYPIYSTYLQNEGHITALRNYIGYPVPMKSILVYSNQSKLLIKRAANSKAVYCHYNSLGNVMRMHASQGKPCLDDEEVSLLYQLLRPLASLR